MSPQPSSLESQHSSQDDSHWCLYLQRRGDKFAPASKSDSLSSNSINAYLSGSLYDATTPGKELLAQRIAVAGRDGLSQWRGDFTVWFRGADSRQWTIYRSPLRGSPVYYHQSEDLLLVGTDLLKICRHLKTLKLNRRWLASFFASRYLDGGHTPFESVSCLPAGSALQIDGDNIAVHRVYQPDSLDIELPKTEKQWAQTWLDSLDSAVSRSVSDVSRIGIMLSSGLDSGGIASALAFNKPRHIEQVQAFSWRFAQYPQADESKAIQMIADSLGIPVHFIEVDDADCFAEPESWPVSLQAPYFNAMRRIKERLYRVAGQQGCEVLLNGHYGDNLYYSDQYEVSELWQHRQWLKLAQQLSHIVRSRPGHFLKEPALRHWGKQLLGVRGRGPWWPDWLDGSLQYEVDSSSPANSHKRPEHYQQMLNAGLLDGLASERELAGGFNLQRRHPYLDETLIALVLAAPAWLLNQPKGMKYLMRQALQDRLPEAVLSSPRVGQLDSVFYAGIQRHHREVGEYLLREQRSWPALLDEAFVQKVLAEQQWRYTASVLVPCLGFERWLDRWRELGISISV